MNLDEILDQYKVLMVWHKYVKILAAVLLAVMIGFIIWGILYIDLRPMLIITGVVFGVCGAALYIAVHRLCIKTGRTLVGYLKTLGMSEKEMADLSAKHKIEFPEMRDNG